MSLRIIAPIWQDALKNASHIPKQVNSVPEQSDRPHPCKRMTKIIPPEASTFPRFVQIFYPIVMKLINTIGLDSQKAKELAEKLNELLANYAIFYQNVRGYHWNIKGDKFFELHQKFEELYNDLLLKLDEVAERVLTLGQAPDHRYSEYNKISQIKESNEVTDGMKAVADILNSYKIIISLQRDLLQRSGEINDEGTHALMSDYIRAQEKQAWMYSSFLGK